MNKRAFERQSSRPVPLPIHVDGIPAQLKALNQWVAWKYVWVENEERSHWSKVPINPKTGRNASTTNAKTWGTFPEALACYRSGKVNGIGFVFTADDPFLGVDIDDCRDRETGAITRAVHEIGLLNSYTEVSPSATGVKVVLRAKLPKGGHQIGGFEFYDRGRYFALTGHKLPDMPAVIESRQEEVNELLARLSPPRQQKSAPQQTAAEAKHAYRLSDEELIEKARAANNGAKFEALWRGEVNGYASNSEADLALCCLLAFWTNRDASRIDSLFRQSGLYREEKWADREDYRTRTITKAIERTPRGYDPATRNSDGRAGELEKRLQSLEEQLILNANNQ